MITTDLILELRACRDNALVGGKALNLARLIQAGFPVPDGFVVTTDAYRYARRQGKGIPADLAESIRAHYRRIGAPPVAVRSSATAEDMSEASMAGQYDTFLDITTEDGVLAAVQKCWASLDSPRTRTYLREHGIDLSQVAMAVVVQRLVPSDVAGVLFTANARTGTRDEMLIEGSWGLGEAVVSGMVQPDVLRIDARNGQVIEATICDKQVCIMPGTHEERPVAAHLRKVPCLKAADVVKLWKLGQLAQAHFGRPQDVEWAIHKGELFCLQSRAITTLEDAAAYEDCLAANRATLTAQLEAGRGPWVLHNIAETLPHPTPLTWSVVRRFMSGAGGYGEMYRMVGFEPSPAACDEGFLTLITGKPYMDLTMAPEMFFPNFPFEYDLDEIRRNPDAGQAPPTRPKNAFAAMRIGGKLAATNAKLRAEAVDFDQRFAEKSVPLFRTWVQEEKARDLTALTSEELLALWQEREHAVLDEFAPLSLLPSLIVGMALADLRAFLDEQVPDEDPDDLLNVIAASPVMDSTMAANAELYAVARGERPAEKWLAEHGHRAPAEFDLATPRWRERIDEVRTMASALAQGKSPLEVHHTRVKQAEAKVAELKKSLDAKSVAALEGHLDLVRRYLRFREDGKDALMRGYDLLRDVAMEIGQRLEVGDGIFLLTAEEMAHALTTTYPPLAVIEERRRQRVAEAKIDLPGLIDAEVVQTLGAPQADGAGQAVFPIATGVASGPVRIVFSPEEAGNLGTGYVLVCPSTDPSWTPLFVNAAALVLERGGTLSHGAVVAREVGIPAVVLPGATSTLREGEIITVDGRNGAILREGDIQTVDPAEDPNNTRIARELVPPPPNAIDRFANTLMTVFLVIWGLYLGAVFLLPGTWLHDRSFEIMDWLYWPLVPAVGKPLTVAIVAASFAAITMIGQRLLTNNARLLEAKRRAAVLRKQAMALPEDSRRRAAMLALANPVQNQVSMAAFVPLAVVLGPLIMTFMWLPARLDPASWNAAPGTSIKVTATVDGEWLEPYTLVLPEGETFAPSAATPVEQKLLGDYKQKLSELYARWASTEPDPRAPWYVNAAGMKTRDEMLASLKAYIEQGIPPQEINWQVKQATPRAGKFAFTVNTTEGPSATIYAVQGDAHAPTPTEVAGAPDSHIKSMKVTYAPAGKLPAFWEPFARFGNPWDAGWLWVYLLAYLPPMILLRWLLRIP